MAHPYTRLPARSFWRTAVAEPAPRDIADLWSPKFPIGQDDPVVTAGSCFARHIGPALLAEGMHWYDAELPPPGLTPAEREQRGYRRFSFRTGNIYTAAALRQWIAWALDEEKPPEDWWTSEKGLIDPYRPALQPGGFTSPEEALAARSVTLAAIRAALTTARVLVFTLGLTEAWWDTGTDTVLPMCPGTVGGTFEPARHVLRNHTVAEVTDDLSAALDMARGVNPRLRTLLTVSPVPLTATATGRHALVATTHSKSVLRAAAGQLADEHDHVDYFPSYEIVTGFPYRAMSYEPNLRTVTPDGVAFVMSHFFAGTTGRRSGDGPRGDRPATAPAPPSHGGEEQACDDAVLDYYGPGSVPPAR
ncbi:MULTISPECIES: GSCFA domain-containing protein [unclassified Streptomyces]|uniref:GSCFA domain-containing protein n=1 Tax=unclassified Streptomyces TaxID=2593676 RepID=UPI0038171A8D